MDLDNASVKKWMPRNLTQARLAAAMLAAVGSLSLLSASCAEKDRAAAGEAKEKIAATIALPATDAATPANFAGIHNVVAYGAGLYSGSAPEGDEGFATLRAMGFRTIISVDGARPEVARAQELGLRYVHLPIGYNGMDNNRTLAIARAVRDLPGPVYLHCHHGKHRSAGAAGAAAVTLGRLTNDEALERMEISGIAPAYKGLLACVKVARPDPAGIAMADASFPNVWKTSGLVDAMVEMDEACDLLKAMDKNAWKPLKDHPDLVPAAEAGKLADHYRMLLEDEKVKRKPAKFRDWLAVGEKHAAALEDGLTSGASAEELGTRLKLVSIGCNACHVEFRN